MPTLGRMEIQKVQYSANMTEQNHLGASLLAKPAILSSVMDQLFSARNLYSSNPVSSILMGAEETIGGTSWEWSKLGADSKPAVIIEEMSTTNAGKYGRELKIKLDMDWYLPSDIITPGNKDYQCRVQADRQKDGNGFIYTLVLMTEDQNASIPVKYLKNGSKWTKLYAQGSEANEQRGSTTMSTPISFQNHLGKLTKQYSVTDYASTEVLAVEIQDPSGKKHRSWIRYADVMYWKQWYKENEVALWYSKSTKTVLDANGRQVRSFPGLQEQLKDGHTAYYNQLTAKFIEEYLMDIFYSRVEPGAGRKIKGYTGEYGMMAFHKAIQDAAQKSGFLQIVDISSNFIGKEKSTYHDNALSYGYQFTKYRMANGSELELVHNPLYDDKEIHTEMDPISGKPIESQRITFLDFAPGDKGKSNIRKVKKKDGYAFGYVEGLYGPYGPSKGGKAAHGGSYYEMHVEDNFGLQIDDVTKCGEMIFDAGQ